VLLAASIATVPKCPYARAVRLTRGVAIHFIAHFIVLLALTDVISWKVLLISTGLWSSNALDI
jgi:hypothetical protein